MRLLPLLAAVLLPLAAAAAQPAPATDYGRLMQTRFFPQTGDVQFNSPVRSNVLFPPPIADPYSVAGAFVVRDAEGEIVGGQRIGQVTPTGSSAIVTAQTYGAPEWSGALRGGGRYTLDMVFENRLIGRVPFTVTSVASGDPFDPGETLVLEGPWRTHAYFRHETDRPDYIMYLDAWVGPDEMASNKQTEVSIRRGGQEVAWGYGFTNMTYGWGLVEYRLYDAGTRDTRAGYARQTTNATSWTLSDVTPGPYEIVFSSEAGAFRTMTAEGGDGAFVHHARSALDYEPREYFLTPRRMVGQNLTTDATLYWIAPPVE